jgi:hypothetical protein
MLNGNTSSRTCPHPKVSDDPGLRIRKIRAGTKEALIEAMGRALAAVSAEDVRGFFDNCGYGAPAQ